MRQCPLQTDKRTTLTTTMTSKDEILADFQVAILIIFYSYHIVIHLYFLKNYVVMLLMWVIFNYLLKVW